MELYLVRSTADEVMDEMRPPPPSTDGVAEPLVRLDATSDAGRVVYAAVPTRIWGEIYLIIVIDEEIVGQDRLVIERPAGGGVLPRIVSGVVGIVVGLLVIVVLRPLHGPALGGCFFVSGDRDWFVVYFRHGSLKSWASVFPVGPKSTIVVQRKKERLNAKKSKWWGWEPPARTSVCRLSEVRKEVENTDTQTQTEGLSKWSTGK
jgi:hypothetical protein